MYKMLGNTHPITPVLWHYENIMPQPQALSLF